MKFSDRPASERTAIDAWIRVTVSAREQACMGVAEDFKAMREQTISELPGDIAKMLHFYASYRAGRQSVSYTQYFQVSHPEEYAAIAAGEKNH